MTLIDMPKLRTPRPSDFKVAPAAKEIQADDIEYCSHCSHCEDNTVLVCGHCEEELTDEPKEPLHCAGCLLDYDNNLRMATYLNPAAHACLARMPYAKESSREGWCYLPKGHESRHYHLLKDDLK